MIKPAPYKVKCPKCGFSAIVRPQSDARPSGDELKYMICPKCGEVTRRAKPNALDILLNPDLLARG